jgi:beta-mannosidase
MSLAEFILDNEEWKLYGYHADQWRPANKMLGAGYEMGPYNAHVPGSVQADLLDADVIPNPYWEDQSKLSEWVWGRHWEYSCLFIPPDTLRGRRVILSINAVDPSATVIFNGRHIGDIDGYGTGFDADVTEYLISNKTNRLQIFIGSPHAIQNQYGSTEQSHEVCPRFGAKWDFGTRYINVGIPGSIKLYGVGKFHFTDVAVRSTINLHTDMAAVSVAATLQCSSGNYDIQSSIYDGEIQIITERSKHSGTRGVAHLSIDHQLRHPQLWWPAGYGEQKMYRLVTEVFSNDGALADRQETLFGIRDIRYVRNENSHNAIMPYTLIVNGIYIFIKGVIIVPFDHLSGIDNHGKIRHYLQLLIEANVNVVRIWGCGGIACQDLYDLCDILGIMVWQDLPLIGSGKNCVSASDARSLSMWESHGPELIRSRRNHPSLIAWCGGDNLQNRDGLPATNRDPLLKLLQKIITEYDTDRIFFPTTPFGLIGFPSVENAEELADQQHDIHGPLTYLGQENEYSLLNGINPLFVGAAGCPGAANHDLMRTVSRENKIWPPSQENLSWRNRGGRWLDFPVVNEMFGNIVRMDDYIHSSQLLQSEAVRYIIESNRRRKWHCSGVMLWHFNEPWPNFISPALIDYFGNPQPAYTMMVKSFSKAIISAKFARIGWKAGEIFFAELHLSNSKEESQPLEVNWQLITLENKILSHGHINTLSHPNASIRAGSVEWVIPKGFQELFLLRLNLFHRGHELHMNDYLFTTHSSPILSPLVSLPDTELKVECIKDDGVIHIKLQNTGKIAAMGIRIFRPDGHWLIGEDNWIYVIMPGEMRNIKLKPKEVSGYYMHLEKRKEQMNVIAVEGWNITPQIINY